MGLTREERAELADLVLSNKVNPGGHELLVTCLKSAALHAAGHCAYSPASEFPGSEQARIYSLLHKALTAK